MRDTALDSPATRQDAPPFDAIRIVAPVLALVCLGLAVATTNFDARLKHAGLTLMTCAISLYLFETHGKPAAQRPPIHFRPYVQRLIVAFCVGTFFCGMGMSGIVGFAIQFLPTIAAIALTVWFAGEKGRAWRGDHIS